MSTNGKDIVGISKSGASKIITAIDEYKKELLEDAAYWFDGTAWEALSGENSQKDFRNMTRLFTSDHEKYINYLNQFKKKLENIIAWYTASDKNNTTFTSSAKSTLNNSGSAATAGASAAGAASAAASNGEGTLHTGSASVYPGTPASDNSSTVVHRTASSNGEVREEVVEFDALTDRDRSADAHYGEGPVDTVGVTDDGRGGAGTDHSTSYDDYSELSYYNSQDGSTRTYHQDGSYTTTYTDGSTSHTYLGSDGITYTDSYNSAGEPIGSDYVAPASNPNTRLSAAMGTDGRNHSAAEVQSSISGNRTDNSSSFIYNDHSTSYDDNSSMFIYDDHSTSYDG